MLPLFVVMLVCLLGIGGALVACKKKNKSEPTEMSKVEEEKEEVKPPKPKCNVQPRDGNGNQFGVCEKHGTSGWDFLQGDCYLCATKTRDLTYLDKEKARIAARKQKKADPAYFNLPPKAD